MEIRKATMDDLGRMMEIYAYARSFMAANGNPNQWGDFWPTEEAIRADISCGCSNVVLHEGRIVGAFFYNKGQDVEPTYAEIWEGQWTDPSPYGVIHRLAGDGSVKGIGEFCIRWALAQHPHLRIDTHEDNKVMRGLFQKLGFTYCGIIDARGNYDPRLAFEITIEE